MNVGAIETSESTLEREETPTSAWAPVALPAEEFEPQEGPPDPIEVAADFVNEDNLEVKDESLNAAARESLSTPPNRRAERLSWIAAFAIAVCVHAAVIALCHSLIVWIRIPFASFTQGSGSSESGLVSDESNQTESESGVPAPPSVLPQPQSENVPPIVRETPKEPDVLPDAQPPVTLVDSDPPSEDSVIIGLSVEPFGPPPTRHRPIPVHAPASVSPAAAPPKPVQTDAIAGASAGHAVAAKHTFVAPRGAGHSGTGASGSGFDDRGLPKPEYPPESLRRKEEGTVELEVMVRADGTVASAHVLKDSGYPRLNNAAIESVRSARFFPATMDGAPIAFALVIPYCFSLH